MKRILIADDAPFMRQMLREIIEPLGYEIVAEAANGFEAAELFALHQPDVVTMDMVMPKGSGVDACRMIRNRFPAAKIVAACTLGQEGLVLEALRAGAANFITKPYQPDVVESVLSWVLEKDEDGVEARPA
ncbi:MAG: response regulator [Myxococcota bacterium]|nr:response regulator [Myxococcota bacterium]